MTILVEDLVKRFGPTTAVDGVSFEAKAGEVTGFLGANGAGKTTTIRVLATLLAPTSGRAVIDGFDTTRDDAEVRNRIGLLTEEAGLFDRLTPRETLRFVADLAGVQKATSVERIERIADDLALTEYLDRRCGELSKGNRQKVALARALVTEPPVLLLDEPTAALDVLAAAGVERAIERATTAGRTVLLSTHIAEEAARLCTRIVVIGHGRIVGDGTPAELAHGGDLRAGLLHLMGSDA